MNARDVLSGDDRGVGAALLRAALTPLAWLHEAGLEAYLLPYRTGLRRRFRLPCPVVAIGNLTSGGTGKTPMAALVGRMLRDEGLRVVLLSRGHGGSHERRPGAKIVSRGEGDVLLPPEVAGDEPALLARLLPDVPVVVGRDRRVSGALAVDTFAPEAILLDDALQFWQLHRDLDICLLDTRRPFDNGFVLPRGLLREPPRHLRRAAVAVLTRYDRADDDARAAARAAVRRWAPDALLLTAVHAPVAWVDPDGREAPRETLRGVRARLVSGIADGASFVDAARALGVDVAQVRDFPDHHAYDDATIAGLCGDGVEAVVTTEKDRVKLAPRWPADAPPLWALRVGMRVDDPEALREALRRAVAPDDAGGAP